MYKGQKVRAVLREGGIAELCFDAVEGSVNKFDQETIEELGEVLAALGSADEVRGLLITSAKPVFIVGADIFSLSKLDSDGLRAVSQRNSGNFNVLEDLPFPSVVAINGFALGGGFEFSMACDFRVMSNAAQVGLPEVKLGLIPGWGGTVRLPRIVGFEKAVEWIASGSHKRADKALADGAVDKVVEPEALEAAALETLQAAIADPAEYLKRRKRKLEGLGTAAKMLVSVGGKMARAEIEKRAGKNFPAPYAALDAIVASVAMPREEALAVEAEAFGKIGITPQSRAMVGLFLSDQYLSKTAKDYAKQSTAKVEQAAVLGAGIMGGGIAYQNALKGFPIVMKDIADNALDLGIDEAKKLLAKRVGRGMAQEKADQALARITPTLDESVVASADFVIEAVVENPKVKASVLSEVEAQLADTAVLTSNTSTISIDSLAAGLSRPENFCGMHFFNPVHAMPLVEIIRGSKTSDETVGRAVAHALALGKKPVVVKDCPGFLVNRVLFPAVVGFDQMVTNGVDFREVDRVMEAWGWPMGPAYLMDVVGIDTLVHALGVMQQGFPERYPQTDAASAIKDLFTAERFGQKNGAGFYQYQSDSKGKPKRTIDEAVFEVIGAPGQTLSDDDIVARFMLPTCIELARCLEEGITGSPAEADMAMIYGLGFPVFRGGVFRWMDEVGLDKICEMAKPLHDLGPLYQPTETMLAMAKEGKVYYS